MRNNFRFDEKQQTEIFKKKILVLKTKLGLFPDIEVSPQVGLKEWLDSLTELPRLWHRERVGGPV